MRQNVATQLEDVLNTPLRADRNCGTPSTRISIRPSPKSPAMTMRGTITRAAQVGYKLYDRVIDQHKFSSPRDQRPGEVQGPKSKSGIIMM